MKKHISILVIFFCLIASSTFAAQSYFSANVGVFMPSDSDISDPLLTDMGLSNTEISYDTGYALSLALGQDLEMVRVEGELSYKAADMDELSATDSMVGPIKGPIDGDIDSLSLMANIWKDIQTGGAVTPYLGLGLGMARLKASLEGDSESDTVFAYQFGLGVGFKAQDNLTLDVSYRYFATSDADFDGTDVEFASHNLMAGIRMGF